MMAYGLRGRYLWRIGTLAGEILWLARSSRRRCFCWQDALTDYVTGDAKTPVLPSMSPQASTHQLKKSTQAKIMTRNSPEKIRKDALRWGLHDRSERFGRCIQSHSWCYLLASQDLFPRLPRPSASRRVCTFYNFFCIANAGLMNLASMTALSGQRNQD
jgi:hypothetical protein